MNKEASEKNRKKHPILRILKGILFFFAALIVLAALGIIVLTVLEYRPQATEPAEVGHFAVTERSLSVGDGITVATWNLGYGALGDNADFFMDGGTMVNTADEARLSDNMAGIREGLGEISPDIVFLQEVDRDSTRSHGMDEMRYLMGSSGEPSFATGMDYAFAYNFRAPFVPFPIPPIGRVNSGIVTFSVYPITEAARIQLPCPFSWPIRIANLKRCLLVSRMPIEGSGRELVLVNLHLEAYDDGEGKIEQTKQLATLLEEEAAAGNYVIAGGDFNQTFTSVDRSAYPTLPGTWASGTIDTEAFSEHFQFCMDNRAPSGRSLDRPLDEAPDKSSTGFQYYLIDGFIVSEGLTVLDYGTRDLGFVCSDHNPVALIVRIEDPVR